MGKVAPSKDVLSSERLALEQFDDHAVAIAQRQYFQSGDEDLAGMFRRVADWVASAEEGDAQALYSEAFYDLMLDKRFCPGGRVMAGAATSHGNVLNCFVQDGRPQAEGSNAWVLNLATKLALVTKVGGGNGLNLDPLPAKRTYRGPSGQVYLTIAPTHPDYDKVRSGTFMDLVHGHYVTKGYRRLTFVEIDQVPAGLQVYRVGDSVESIWQNAGDTIMTLLEGEDVVLDVSALRAEGTPVNGSGGTSSGPSSFSVEVFDNFAYWASLGGADHAGPIATLRYIFAPTLRVIRQGGTRRGAGMATMSIENPDIHDFITSKDLRREEAEGDISTFNISVLVTDAFMERAVGGGGGVLRDIADHAWQTGEPGLIYIDRINEYNPMRASFGDIRSTNPCVTADTWVTTSEGARRVHDLIGVPFVAQVDGEAYRTAGFFSTGSKPVFRITTDHGYRLDLTANHPLHRVVEETRYRQELSWVEAGELQVGDRIALSNHRGAYLGKLSPLGYLIGYLIGDGTTDKGGHAHLDFWGESRDSVLPYALEQLAALGDPAPWVSESGDKVRVTSRLLYRLAEGYGVRHGNKTLTPELEATDHAFALGVISGLVDADGSVQGTQLKGISLRISQSDSDLLRAAQRILARAGIVSKLYENRRDAGTSLLPDGRGGMAGFEVKAQHELIISRDNLVRFAEVVTLRSAKATQLDRLLCAFERTPNRERFSTAITAIEQVGVRDVYDVTVEEVHAFDANGLRAHNCGEIPLYPGEPCDLGAMNLAAYVAEQGTGIDGFDFERFRSDTELCTRFLDNVLDVNIFALDDNRDMSMKLRRLGLGVMGLADALIKMGYAYDSDEGRAAVDAMIGALRDAATAASEALAAERGEFPLCSDSSLTEGRRNIAVLTVAPTGTTSMLMGVSSGVEPVFAPFIHRKIGDSYAALIHPLFRELLEEHPPHPGYSDGASWDWDKVVEAVQENHGSVQGLDFVPDAVTSVLLCAHDIAPEAHVRMQGTVQRAFDGGKMVANSISKTINLPNGASADDVYHAYRLAFETGCKGITVYRDGSRQFQVLSTSSKKADAEEQKQPVAADTAPASAPPRAATMPRPAKPPAPAPAEPQPLPGEPLFDRPVRLEGFTDQVKLTLPSGEQRGFYVTVNKQDGLPTEVFINSGKAGDEANADSEALGRTVSIALQYGVPAEAIVKTLRGINGGMYGTYQGRMVASKADLIAIALETAGVENVLNRGKGCPDCGAPLRFEEGCEKCEGCGYSKCG